MFHCRRFDIVYGTLLLLLIQYISGCEAFHQGLVGSRKISFPSAQDTATRQYHPRLFAACSSTSLFFANNNNEDAMKDDDGVNFPKALSSALGWSMILSYVFGWTLLIGFFVLPLFGLDFVADNGRLSIGTAEQGQFGRESVKQAKDEQQRSAVSSVISADSELLNQASS